MKRLLFPAITVLALATPAVAGADMKECQDDYAQSQVLRDSGKLIRARELLLVCARDECGKTIPKECSAWLADVERRISGVVIAVKSGAGADLVEVKVTMDGAVVATKLDGHAISVDPGEHSFVFEIATGEKAEQRVVVREGEKAQAIAVTIGQAPASVPVPTLTATNTTPPPPPDPVPSASNGSTLRTVGFVLGGAGIVGLGIGGFFGLQAMSKKSDANCNSDNFCQPGPLSDARSNATISTIGFIAGGALLAGGVALVIFAPKEAKDMKTTRLEAVPMLGSGNGGLMFRGRW